MFSQTSELCRLCSSVVLQDSVCFDFSMMIQGTVFVFVNLADMFHHSYHCELMSCFNSAECPSQTGGASRRSKGAEGNTEVFMTNRTERDYGEDSFH